MNGAHEMRAIGSPGRAKRRQQRSGSPSPVASYGVNGLPKLVLTGPAYGVQPGRVDRVHGQGLLRLGRRASWLHDPRSAPMFRRKSDTRVAVRVRDAGPTTPLA